jgi:hypothetical protein
LPLPIFWQGIWDHHPPIKDGTMTNPYQNQDPQYGANPYQAQDPQYGAGPYQAQDPQYGAGPYQTQEPQYGAGPYQTQDPQQGYGNYGQQPSQPTYQQQMYQQPKTTGNGFFARLFDLSFDHYVTTSVIKVIFIVIVVLQGLSALSFVASAFVANTTAGIITFLIAPIVWFFAVLLTRVWMELLIVIFKIKEDLGVIRARGEI